MLVLVIALLVNASSMVAQQPETGKPMFFDTAEACLAAGEFTVYQPKFRNKLTWWEEAVDLKKAVVVKDHGKKLCAEEFTADGWKIIRWPDNNSYFRHTDGRLADGRCGNEVRRIWEIPPPAPPAPPTTIRVNFTKEAFGPNGEVLPVPTGLFRFCVGETCVKPDENGKASVVVVDGNYDITEEISSSVWELWNLSKSRITKGEGPVVNVIVKNRQLRPPPSEPPHVCPNCGQVVPSQPLDAVVLADDMQLGLRVNWPGVKVLGYWYGQTQLSSTDSVVLTRQHFAGAGKYELEVRGEDDKGHVVKCTFVIIATEPPTVTEVVPGHPWWHWIPPVFCVDVHKKSDLWKPAVCGAAAGLGWWLWPVQGAAKIIIPIVSIH